MKKKILSLLLLLTVTLMVAFALSSCDDIIKIYSAIDCLPGLFREAGSVRRFISKCNCQNYQPALKRIFLSVTSDSLVHRYFKYNYPSTSRTG